ncbi:MAG: SoxR reducing system RseC family protein [Gammaproteobacteria bacterium]|nr:SoxR reducing system RseC family protein [Gammaproteobacteria bacterium]
MFRRVRCAGCVGRCGVSVGGGELPVDFGLPDGTPVQVAMSPHDFARRALVVFGWPLGAVGAAAAVTEWFGVSEGFMVAAFLGTALAVVGVRAASRTRGTPAVHAHRRTTGSDDGVRVVVE